MGWLKDLMQLAEPPVLSYGALARIALRSPEWPADQRQQERSLASILSKLDRGIELDWLADREPVQRAFASVLGRSVAEVRSALETRPSAVGAGVDRFELRDFAWARRLDLRTEPLPSALPSLLGTPGLWDRNWWTAPVGDARALVGRWLEARGVARYAPVATWDEAVKEAARGGAVFVDVLVAPEDGRVLAPPKTASLCVACSAAPSRYVWDGGDPPAWHRVPDLPLDEVIERTLLWLAPRLPEQTALDPEATRRWLAESDHARSLLEGFDAVVGLCGLCDEIELRTLRAKSAPELAELFSMRRIIENLGDASPDRSWLKRNAFSALSDTMVQALLRRTGDWDAPRTLDDWVALVPAEYHQTADVEWLKLSLGGASGVRAADLDKAARRLPPGAFRLVRALERAGLLRSVGAGFLSLGPRWLALSLRRHALEKILDGPPLDLGDALLDRKLAPQLIEKLRQRFELGRFDALERALESELEHSAEQAALVEGMVRAVGLALLSGAEAPIDALETLWEEQYRLFVELGDELPKSRIDFAPDLAANLAARDTDGALVLSQGVWLASVIALTEQLPSRGGPRHAVLRPWTEPAAAPLKRAYDVIGHTLQRAASGAAWVANVFSMVHRLRGLLGSVDTASVHSLEAPSVAAEEAAHGVLSYDSIAALRSSSLDALRAIVGPDDAWPVVAAAFWSAWEQAGQPKTGAWFVAAESPVARHFWPHIPGELLLELLRDPRPKRLPYEHFGEAQWTAWTSFASEAGSALSGEALLRVPKASAEQLLERGLSATALVSPTLWSRFGDLLISHAARQLAEGLTHRALETLEAAPDDRSEDALELLRSRVRPLDLAPDQLERVRRFLYVRVGRRCRGFERAYRMLSEIEAALSELGTRTGR